MEDTQPAAAPVADTPAPAVVADPTPDDSGGYNPDAALDSAILARLEDAGVDTESEDGTPAPVKAEPADEAPETPSVEAKQPAETDEDALAKELGIDPAKNNRIPYAKVKKILANTEKRLTEQHTAALTERETKIQTYEGRLSQVESVEKIMAGEPERFLKLLVDVNPAYANLIGGKQAQPAAADAIRPDATMPQPDYDLGNGQATYSDKGLVKLLEWNAAQAAQRAETALLTRLDPILKRHEAEERIAQEAPRVQKQLERLSTRPLFMENIDAIHGKVREGVDADEAYWTIVGPQLIADRNKMHAEIVKGMKTLPKSTSVGVTAATPKADDPEDSMNARILNRLKAGGGLD